ncbi:DUF3365 domain-containing protein [Candidatus Nitronereus thalassa]|uniref:DUF3365 domain-containing protein n=1 Tax=Candidatus Nitronereus thalassa TaxID=3020898 RepID=A0ABU3K803_9BACT|nr:DUF3365 domain-containing protein [Candidatus Nitronereus thalassa]MDT7042513.1 DUF3365 domain-containing protein [Candidatus Nitronereus thalassa]
MKVARRFQILSIAVAIVLIGFNVSWPHEYSGDLKGIDPMIVAEYIHAVIESDRTLYAIHVVERMQDTGTAIASERWEAMNALPLPAQMLLLSGKRVQKMGVGLHYRLASLWPIYAKNGPKTDFEQQGLEAVVKDGSQPYTDIIEEGNTKFFVAIYADRAVSSACVNCHNTHILSPKRDQKLGDVMGGLIISFPVQ